jgi:hypothetical protein
VKKNTVVNTKSKFNNHGSALLFVLSTLVVLSVIGSSLLGITTTSTDIFFNSYKKTTLHLEGEGVIRGFTRLTQSYIENISSQTVSLHDFIAAQVTSLTPTNYTIVSWNVVVDQKPIVQNLPTGVFKGMQSSTTAVHYQVELLENNSGIKGTVNLDGLIAGVTFTQFATFAFRELYVFGDIPVTLNGRIHGNDLVCIGAGPAQVRSITSGGDIQHVDNCFPFPTPKHAWSSTDGTMANLKEIKASATSGCTNCDGTGLDWSAYALANWNGNVLDATHGVPKLELKYAGTPVVQSRKTDLGGVTIIEPQYPERILVDPPLASDTPSISSVKMASKADIRIINGVWYIKDPSNDSNWPGIPVWSDHPGTFAAFPEEGIVPNKGFIHPGAAGVGQSDIRTWMSSYGGLNAWPAGKLPQKFSYYEWDPSGHSIVDNNGGVISYGGTMKKGVNQWVPGQLVKNDGSGVSSLCKNPTASCTNCATPDKIRAYDDLITCSNGPNPSAWEYQSLPITSQQAQSKILPVNFDMDTFQKALKCNYDPANPSAPGSDHPGEIGCFFTTWGLMKRPFNGIVYITNTWKGSMNTVMTAAPFNQNDFDPDHAGNNTDLSQIAVTHTAEHQALPFELCSDDPSVIGDKFDQQGLFKIPSCARYNEAAPPIDALHTRPSWIRILNAKTIDATVLPKGISIVSNLQVYMTGDVNSSSNTAPGGTPWSPILIGGDQVVPLSNSWSDDSARWDLSAHFPAPTPPVKIASDTTYNMALLSGQGTLFMYNENWSGKNMVFRGPAINPYDALNIYMKQSAFTPSYPNTFQYPNRDTAYDSHYESIYNQPPGVPLLTLFAITSWL